MHSDHRETTANPQAIFTASGRAVQPLSARREDIDVEDIAAALSKLCRFGGHCSSFYSVAQHSVHVAELLEHLGPAAALAGLLHDATEAYLADVPGPIKHHPDMAAYRAAEDRLATLIRDALSVSPEYSAEVKQADAAMFDAELRDLVPAAARHPVNGSPPVSRIDPWPPHVSEDAFLEAYARYSRALNAAGGLLASSDPHGDPR